MPYRMKDKHALANALHRAAKTTLAASTILLACCRQGVPPATSPSYAPTPVSAPAYTVSRGGEFESTFSPTTAGYAVLARGGDNAPLSERPKGVSCSWKVQNIEPSDELSELYQDAKIGGINITNYLTRNIPSISIGTGSLGIGTDTGATTVRYSAWYIVSSGSVSTQPQRIPSLNISPGDTISANISSLGNDNWQLEVKDASKNENFKSTVSFNVPGYTAGCMIHVPTWSNGDVRRMPDFISIPFGYDATKVSNTNYVTIGKESGPLSAFDYIRMNMTNARSSDISGDGSFSVVNIGPHRSYKRTPPQWISENNKVSIGQFDITLHGVTSIKTKPVAQFVIYDKPADKKSDVLMFKEGQVRMSLSRTNTIKALLLNVLRIEERTHKVEFSAVEEAYTPPQPLPTLVPQGLSHS